MMEMASAVPWKQWEAYGEVAPTVSRISRLQPFCNACRRGLKKAFRRSVCSTRHFIPSTRFWMPEVSFLWDCSIHTHGQNRHGLNYGWLEVVTKILLIRATWIR